MPAHSGFGDSPDQHSERPGLQFSPRQITIKVIGLLLAGVLGFGCAGGSGSSGGIFTMQGSKVLVTGDWDDVDAAVRAAAGHREMVVETQSTSPDGKTQTFELLTAKDERVEVVASRDFAADPAARLSMEGPIVIRLTVRVGTWGDSVREQELIDDIRSRLGDLIGPFKTQPLPSGW
jgi:hypothetical protein